MFNPAASGLQLAHLKQCLDDLGGLAHQRRTNGDEDPLFCRCLVAGRRTEVAADQLAAKERGVFFLKAAHELLRQPVDFFFPGRRVGAARQAEGQQRAGYRSADLAAAGNAAAEGRGQFKCSRLVYAELRRESRKNSLRTIEMLTEGVNSNFG